MNLGERFIRIWTLVFGISFPLLDFAIGAAAGALYDWIEPSMQHYPIPTWLGWGVSSVVGGAAVRFFRWLSLGAPWWDDKKEL